MSMVCVSNASQVWTLKSEHLRVELILLNGWECSKSNLRHTFGEIWFNLRDRRAFPTTMVSLKANAKREVREEMRVFLLHSLLDFLGTSYQKQVERQNIAYDEQNSLPASTDYRSLLGQDN